ncbi:DUF6916 family protein [Vallitalea guaymasensis]|uniref:DUF6916 domain-containing protein n=1 Tax=Vallitalea guaymasensis TaxID=1185412 RepID=A0A8J8MCU0_9FIRM|nr:hypothetical protein [Vallitalea guaymasensis]QUH30320.1 hypothetical protein HYG85_15985 [Vallitalea guaymasensis]
MVDLSTLSKIDFDTHINTTFNLSKEDTLVDLELIETRDCSTSKIESFSLLFKGPVDTLYPQDTYSLDHEKMGELNILIVPVDKNEKGIYYEAIFTRFKK